MSSQSTYQSFNNFPDSSPEFHNRVELLESFSLKKLISFYRDNPTWIREVDTTLHKMRDRQELKYWDTVNEYINAYKEYHACYSKPHPGVIGPPIRDTKNYYEKYMDLCNKRKKLFHDQVKIEKFIIKFGFATSDEISTYSKHMDMVIYNLDPYDIPSKDFPDDDEE
jgi:hypothetical protein